MLFFNLLILKTFFIFIKKSIHILIFRFNNFHKIIKKRKIIKDYIKYIYIFGKE